MALNITSNSRSKSSTIFVLFLLVTLAKYNIYMGFALKPYMIFSILYLMIHIGSFYFYRLQLFEVAMLLFYAMYSLTGAFALHPDSSLRIILGIMLYLTCYFIMKSIIGKTERTVMESAISNVGIIFNSASLLLYFVGLKSVGFVFEGDRIYQYGMMLDRDYPRLIGVLEDPNYYVFYNTLFFSYYLCNMKSWKNKGGLILCILTNLLTFSRGGLLVMTILLIIYILLNNPLKQLRLILGLVIAFSLTAYVSVAHMKFNLLGMLESRVEDVSQDKGSGRLELWSRAWEYFESNIFVGLGAYNFTDYNAFDYGNVHPVHNTFLDVLSESGLLGITCYLMFILLVFFQLIQSKIYKHSPYLFVTFLGLVLQMGFLSIIINDMFFMYIAILSTYITDKDLAFKKEMKMERIEVSTLTTFTNN
jgi:O-antigen ligase